MIRAPLSGPADVEGWRAAARRLAGAGVPPADVAWVCGGQDDLLASGGLPDEPREPLRVPRAFVTLTDQMLRHEDERRFGLAYRMLWRIANGERLLLKDAADPDVRRAGEMASEIRRDIHKMHAFVRFRQVDGGGGGGDDEHARFAAWFEPDHHIVEAAAPFFACRFSTMRWSILTPRGCAHWEGETLGFTGPASRRDAPDGDPLEETWRTYYASTFNPARANLDAMRSEMPAKYWKNLPEARLIAPLLREARTRTRDMIDVGASEPAPRGRVTVARPELPDDPRTLGEIGGALDACERCPLHRHATAAVMGEGPADASIVLVGEQPGDREDLSGRPFVGPAGRLLDGALEEALLPRRELYLTSAVKHFKYEQRGRRRLHRSPDRSEIDACRTWLMREIDAIEPHLVVAMGVTAVRSLTGRAARVESMRGRVIEGRRFSLLVTVHPSFLLRLPDPRRAEEERARFVADLGLARSYLALPPKPGMVEAASLG